MRAIEHPGQPFSHGYDRIPPVAVQLQIVDRNVSLSNWIFAGPIHEYAYLYLLADATGLEIPFLAHGAKGRCNSFVK